MENSLRAGQWVLFGWKFTEQHLASWLNSLRLGEPQEKRAVSHPLIPSEPMPASLFQTWSHWSQTQGSFGMSSFLCKGLYPGGLGWVVDWLHCRAFYQRTECGGACQGAGSGRCLINKKYSCFYIEQVWQPALFLPEPRHERFVRATVTQLGRMLFRVTYWHQPSVHSDGPAPSFAFSQGLPLLPHPPSYSRSNKDQLWFWELLKNSKTNTFFSLLSQTVSCSPELESHVYNASNLCARFCTETPLGLVLQARFEPVLWHSPPWCPVPEETVLSFLDWRQFSFAGNSDFRTYLLRKKFPVLDLEKGKNHSSPWPSPDGHKVFH